MIMKVKCMILAIVMSLGICGCSGDNNGAVLSTEGAVKVPAAQAYDGYEELQGKDFEILVMPEKIKKQEISEIYSFTCTPLAGLDEKQTAEDYFRAMAGEAFDSSFITHPSDRHYRYSDPEEFTMEFSNGCPINAAYRGAMLEGTYHLDVIGCYYADEDRDVPLELKNGTFTVGEICRSISATVSRVFYPLYDGFDIYPYKIDYYLDGDTSKVAEVTCAVRYKGMTLEIGSSPLFEIVRKNGYEVITNYCPNYMTFDIDTLGSIRFFYNSFAPRDVIAEEQSSMLSLGDAVKLLEENLAEHSRYIFTDAELLYCCKSTYASPLPGHSLDEVEEEFPESRYEPTWCFVFKLSEDKYGDIKVNALSGEITVEGK